MTDVPLSLGTKTPWGTVQAVGCKNSGRFYMLLNKHGVVTLMPADLAEYPRFRDEWKESRDARP